jgi:6-phosphogluconolactonase
MIVSTGQVVRLPDAAELATQTARRLLDALVELQADGKIPQLCLAGGRSAMAMYAEFADLVPCSGLDPSRLELWWSDERFLPADDPERNAGPALALLARSFAVDPARTHSMPSADGVVDADASANTYAKELGDTVFDLCLLGMGPDGHVASIFPHHPSSEPTTAPVIGVSDAPKPPPERISLTIDRINTSAEVWLLVSGQDKAGAVARALAGDAELPAAQVAGRERTIWFVDETAAGALPYFECAG